MLKYRNFYLLWVFLCQPFFMLAQRTAMTDTIRLDMNAVQQRFLAKNLTIIASRFNIDIAKALVIQAKTYYNPNLGLDGSVYNNQSRKYFDYSYYGNVDGQFTQLFSIAGKHINTVKLAKVSEAEAELAFQDFMRALNLQLYSDYKNIFYSQQQIDLLNAQEKALGDLITASEQMLKLGAISGNDLFRLKAELNDLENQSVAVASPMLDAQADLKTLLNYSEKEYLVLTEFKPSTTAPPPLRTGCCSCRNEPTRRIAFSQKCGIQPGQLQTPEVNRSTGPGFECELFALWFLRTGLYRCWPCHGYPYI
jgi:cobalt-zinc-cadmium efflux system outer membrane protein